QGGRRRAGARRFARRLPERFPNLLVVAELRRPGRRAVEGVGEDARAPARGRELAEPLAPLGDEVVRVDDREVGLARERVPAVRDVEPRRADELLPCQAARAVPVERRELDGAAPEWFAAGEHEPTGR